MSYVVCAALLNAKSAHAAGTPSFPYGGGRRAAALDLTPRG